MSLSVEVIGLKEFIEDAKQSGANAEPLMKAALFNSATRIQTNVRERAPHRTGALQRSILAQVDYPMASVTTDEKYAQYVEYGTPPHIIEPKNKQALFWKGALNPYKKVHHPGTKANPFFAKGVQASAEFIQEQFIKVRDRLVSELAGIR